MQYTDANNAKTAARDGNGGGRAVSELSARLREDISRGRFAAGTYLPTVRELSRKQGLACSTVHRALRALVEEGLLSAEARHGYRVMPGASDPMKGCPVAYVFSSEEEPPVLGAYHRSLLAAFQGAASARGWSLLSTHAGDDGAGALLEKLAAARTSGLVLDMHSRRLIEAMQGSGLPCVMVNSWREDVNLDVVMQDGQQGGLQAATYLAGRGHKKIAWFGPVTDSGHSMDRFAGAMLGMRRAGLEPLEEYVTEQFSQQLIESARRMLASPKRPRAILALWQDCCSAVAQAAAELGLVTGRDFEMVGWCREEEYSEGYAASFRPGELPPTVVWSAGEMAVAALDLLSLRRADASRPALRVKIPTRLRMPDEK